MVENDARKKRGTMKIYRNIIYKNIILLFKKSKEKKKLYFLLQDLITLNKTRIISK